MGEQKKSEVNMLKFYNTFIDNKICARLNFGNKKSNYTLINLLQRLYTIDLQ